MTGRKGRVISTDEGNVQYQSRAEDDVPVELLNITEKQVGVIACASVIANERSGVDSRPHKKIFNYFSALWMGKRISPLLAKRPARGFPCRRTRGLAISASVFTSLSSFRGVLIALCNSSVRLWRHTDCDVSR